MRNKGKKIWRKKIIRSSAVWRKKQRWWSPSKSRLKSRAHHYRWSSTCCSASERAARLRPVAPSRTCSRTDYPPAAADRPTPFATVAERTTMTGTCHPSRTVNRVKSSDVKCTDVHAYLLIIGTRRGTEQVHDRLISIVGWRTEEGICAGTTRWRLHFSLQNRTYCKIARAKEDHCISTLELLPINDLFPSMRLRWQIKQKNIACEVKNILFLI